MKILNVQHNMQCTNFLPNKLHSWEVTIYSTDKKKIKQHVFIVSLGTIWFICIVLLPSFLRSACLQRSHPRANFTDDATCLLPALNILHSLALRLLWSVRLFRWQLFKQENVWKLQLMEQALKVSVETSRTLIRPKATIFICLVRINSCILWQSSHAKISL